MESEKEWKMPPLVVEEEDEEEGDCPPQKNAHSDLRDARYPLKHQYCGCTYPFL